MTDGEGAPPSDRVVYDLHLESSCVVVHWHAGGSDLSCFTVSVCICDVQTHR